MPSRAKPRTRKRNYRRKTTRYRKRNMLSFSKAPVPNRFATKLRYVSERGLVVDPALAAPGVYVVSANSLFDPNHTGAGHQPRGFDQFMTMYDHYTVVGCKITVTLSQTNDRAYDPSKFGIALKDAAPLSYSLNDYCEGRNVVSTMMPGKAATNVGTTRTLSKTFSARKFLGVSKPLASSILRGSIVASPDEQAYFHIFNQSVFSTNTELVNVWFRVEYLVVFTEPKQPDQS